MVSAKILLKLGRTVLDTP